MKISARGVSHSLSGVFDQVHQNMHVFEVWDAAEWIRWHSVRPLDP